MDPDQMLGYMMGMMGDIMGSQQDGGQPGVIPGGPGMMQALPTGKGPPSRVVAPPPSASQFGDGRNHVPTAVGQGTGIVGKTHPGGKFGFIEVPDGSEVLLLPS